MYPAFYPIPSATPVAANNMTCCVKLKLYPGLSRSDDLWFSSEGLDGKTAAGWVGSATLAIIP